MALYARHGALLNHDSMPNCWTRFVPQTDGTGATRYAVVLRTLVAVPKGEELTIAYMDVAKPRAELEATLARRYFISPATGGATTQAGLRRPTRILDLLYLDLLYERDGVCDCE